MLVLSEPLKGVRGDIGLHILYNKTFVKHQNKEISRLGDNKVVALGAQRHETHLEDLLQKLH